MGVQPELTKCFCGGEVRVTVFLGEPGGDPPRAEIKCDDFESHPTGFASLGRTLLVYGGEMNTWQDVSQAGLENVARRLWNHALAQPGRVAEAMVTAAKEMGYAAFVWSGGRS